MPEGHLLPAVKIFSRAGYVWLLTRSSLDQPDSLFGLCDGSANHPEVGFLSREWMEVADLEITPGERGPLERDDEFYPHFPLEVYKAAAESHGFITEEYSELQKVAEDLGYTEDQLEELRGMSEQAYA